MTITLRIRGGAAQIEESLCRTCRCAHIQRGFRASEEAIFCNFGQFRPVPFKVSECTDYANRNVPFRFELEKMALLINVQPTRKNAGFKSGAGFVAQTDVGEETETE